MNEHTGPRERLRVLAVSDSDSYVKWGAALLSRAPEEWEKSMLVLKTPALPSSKQLAAAFAGSEISEEDAAVVELKVLAQRVAELQPDVMLLSVRGPVLRVIVRAVTAVCHRRPIFVSGLPGISIPPNRKALAFRAQADVFVLHSRREVREFAELAELSGFVQRFGLAKLPFLPERIGQHEPGGDIIFAAQAKVPKEKDDRLALLGWLADTARHDPTRNVVIKVRAQRGEQQTHAEAYDYPSLLAELDPPAPANLVVAGGSMAKYLETAGALVTVSSTAAIEAIALGVPVLAIDDFGVRKKLINLVFKDSGMLGSSRDMIDGRFQHPVSGWLDDNYFHDDSQNDWVAQTSLLLMLHAQGALPLKPQPVGTLGGSLRHAWDRKKALGPYDRSFAGHFALALGTPAVWGMRAVRKTRKLVKRTLRTVNGSAAPGTPIPDGGSTTVGSVAE